jgi:hypothetical protein
MPAHVNNDHDLHCRHYLSTKETSVGILLNSRQKELKASNRIHHAAAMDCR